MGEEQHSGEEVGGTDNGGKIGCKDILDSTGNVANSCVHYEWSVTFENYVRHLKGNKQEKPNQPDR